MKIKATMRQMKNAQVDFISLVARGANRIPFRVIKSEGGNMLDLTQLRHVFKGEAPAQPKPASMGFAEILRGSKPAPQPVAKAAPVLQSIAKSQAPVQSIAKLAQRLTAQQAQQQVQEERQREGLAPNQPLHHPAPRRAGNTPKVVPSRDTVTLKELRGEIDSALSQRRKQEEMEAFNAKRSAFSQISPTQPHHVQGGGRGDAWSLRNHGGQLGVQLLGGTGERLPTNTAFRPFSGAGSKA